ncbi:MAG: hypothetical protein K6T83_09110 [Alicyclobacillus sp.]|nr:hypothetical protein [Alicyclobacillus sp.]
MNELAADSTKDSAPASKQVIIMWLGVMTVFGGVLALGLFVTLKRASALLLSPGRYALANTDIRPLPSVVYDPSRQEFQIQVVQNGQNQTVDVPMDQMRIATTDRVRALDVGKDGRYTLYLHKDDEIIVERAGSGSGGFVTGMIVGHLLK